MSRFDFDGTSLVQATFVLCCAITVWVLLSGMFSTSPSDCVKLCGVAGVSRWTEDGAQCDCNRPVRGQP